jgi:hypothetical protein
MRWVLIALVAFASVNDKVAQAEPVRVSLEWIELDCTKCPELATRLQSTRNLAIRVERGDSKFVDLEKKAAKRMLVEHVQWIEPGTKVKQTTRLNDSTFDLELAINRTQPGNYEAVVYAKLRQGTEEIHDSEFGFTLAISPGQSWVTGIPIEKSVATRRVTSYNFVDILSERINGPKAQVLVTGPKIQALVISVSGPGGAGVKPPLGTAD